MPEDKKPEDDDSDDDFDDLWGDMENDDDTSTLTVSANLLEAVGQKDEKAVHKGDVDEGKITWEPPTFAGLTNSDSVTIKMQHWYKDKAEEVKEKAADEKAEEAAAKKEGGTKADTLKEGGMENDNTVVPEGPVLKVKSAAGTLEYTPKTDEQKPFESMFTFTATGGIKW